MRSRFMVMAMGVAVLAGCGGPTNNGPMSNNPGSSDFTRTSGNTNKGPVVDVVAFKGGYDIDFYAKAAQELQDKTGTAQFKVSGNPRVWEQLRPRFIAGTPPDLAFPGWDMGYWALVYENQVTPWDEALQEKAYGTETKWLDTFEPSLLRLGQYEGKQYLMPYYFSMNGWWYDPTLFAKNGWTAPKNWTELLALCEAAKAKGIAPITFQGKYPYYMITGFLFPWVISAGGIQALDDAQALKPGAWNSPAMLEAANRIDELRKKGYLQPGATAMSHTESQMEFVQNRALMIPCGTWLNSEMKNVMPKGFKMAYFNPPTLDGGKDASNVSVGIEPWIIPSKAKNPKPGIELFRYMTSLDKAKQFVREKGTFTAIKGSDQTELPEHLKDAATAFRASKAVWSVEYIQWYPKLGKESQDAMSSLLNGEITPQQFCDRCEAAATEARNDKSLPKHATKPR
ncbi:MAG: extracellular solute-binding protein [Fimbriimonas sp.]